MTEDFPVNEVEFDRKKRFDVGTGMHLIKVDNQIKNSPHPSDRGSPNKSN